MKKQTIFTAKRWRILGVITVLLLALWMSCRPIAIQGGNSKVIPVRHDYKMIETKRTFRTGKNLRPFQRLIVPYVDEPNVQFQFHPMQDYTELMDSLAPNWQRQGKDALNWCFGALTHNYQKEDRPILYGTWDQKIKIKKSPHFQVHVQIESISITRKRGRELKWAHIAEDLSGDSDTAFIYHRSYDRDITISGALQILDANGEQILRRPLSKSKLISKSWFDRKGPQALIERAPTAYTSSLRLFGTNQIIHSDAEAIYKAIREYAHEAVRCANKWLIHPIYDAKNKKNTTFDLRDREVILREYIDTTRLVDKYPEISIYKPFKK